MYISKISAQHKIHFGAQNGGNVPVLEPEDNVVMGNLGDALDSMASVGKSSVKAHKEGEIIESDDDGFLKHTRRIEDGKYIDSYYSNGFTPPILDYIVYTPVQKEGQPEDKSRLEISFWEDGKTIRAFYKYDENGNLVESDVYDREEPPIPEYPYFSML